MSQLITDRGDILPLPITIVWGGLNGNLSNDATKIQYGNQNPYSYPNAVLAQAAFNLVTTLLSNWDGVAPVDMGYSQSSTANQITISAVSSPNFNFPIPGQSITVSGTNFDSSIQVFIGTALAQSSVIGTTQLTVVLPQNNNGTYDLTIYRPSGGSAVSAGAVVYASPLIPVMTSNTTPSGIASASSSYPGDSAYTGFINASNGWSSATGVVLDNTWLQYQFASGQVVVGYSFLSVTAQSFNLQGSNDGSAWVNISAIATVSAGQFYTSPTNANTPPYTYFRLQFYGPGTGIAVVAGLQMYG